MNNSFFIDTDVIIDFLIDREPHAKDATHLIDLAEKKIIKLYTSSLCLNNVHYVSRKVIGDTKARMVIGELMRVIDVLSVSKNDVKNAIDSDFKDFEDAIQHSVAIGNTSIKSILTRNVKDYSKSKISVFSPEMQIQILQNEG